MEWISVKDKLPMDGEDYLCVFEGWDGMFFQRTLTYDVDEKFWDDWNGCQHEGITHYMKLPKPPNN